ncbi:MAG TPA: serine/threonine-protein kinase, partial [Polyangiaceae bacterium]
YDADVLFCPRDGTPLGTARTSAPSSGDSYLGVELAGQIRLKHLIGMGSMGRVYKAWQQGIERDVAVKVLHRELSGNAELVSRFHREAKVSSRLIHPNVVQVLMTGCLPLRADPRLGGELYLVMEFLDGISLLSALAAAGAGSDGAALPLTRALHIVLQICDAVGEAHAQNIVHRDLKPENVMLVRRGGDPDFVKVLDFGIARLNWGEQSMATAAGLIFGTARYISPEGAQGEAVGPPGDVYAIATLLYQMLSARTPFEGEQAVHLLVQQIHDRPPPLRSVPRAAYVPEPIAEVVMKNLAKDPLAREADARALAQALFDAIHESGMSVEDIVARPRLSLRSNPLRVAPLERTRQALQSDPLVAQLQTVPLVARASQPSFPDATPGPILASPRPSGVEITLDDSATPPPAAARASTPAPTPLPMERTQAVQPIAEALAPLQRSSPSYPGANIESTVDDAPPRRAASTGEEPFSTIPGLGSPRRQRSRVVVLFVLCFLVGVVGSATVAYKFGLVGQPSEEKTVERQVARANQAIADKRWDSPPGDNVLELTNEGLARWPGDGRLIEVRGRACDILIEQAVSEKLAGHLDKAMHLATLAHELDPADEAAAKLREELVSLVSGVDAGTAPTKSDAGAKPPPVNGTAVFVAPARAAFEAVPAKPRSGQPVEILVHVFGPNNGAPKAAATEVFLTVVGPNVPAGTRIPTIADGPSTVRGGLTFFEPGKYDVAFTGKVDGVVVKATSTIVVVPASAPPPGTADAAPAPSGKWL